MKGRTNDPRLSLLPAKASGTPLGATSTHRKRSPQPLWPPKTWPFLIQSPFRVHLLVKQHSTLVPVSCMRVTLSVPCAMSEWGLLYSPPASVTTPSSKARRGVSANTWEQRADLGMHSISAALRLTPERPAPSRQGLLLQWRAWPGVTLSPSSLCPELSQLGLVSVFQTSLGASTIQLCRLRGTMQGYSEATILGKLQSREVATSFFFW